MIIVSVFPFHICASRHFHSGKGPSRDLLRDCTTSPINNAIKHIVAAQKHSRCPVPLGLCVCPCPSLSPLTARKLFMSRDKNLRRERKVHTLGNMCLLFIILLIFLMIFVKSIYLYILIIHVVTWPWQLQLQKLHLQFEPKRVQLRT